MKISVVIPYFKNAKNIENTLNSVISQVFQDFEILIINDASPDWDVALPIIESFKDARIKTLTHQKNKNGAAARNTGIKASKGMYIAFLDADDEWLPNHLNNLIEVLKTESPEAVYTTCTVLSANRFSYTTPKKALKTSKNIGEYLFADEGFMQTSGLMVKTEMAKLCLFNEDLIRHQDYDFLLQLEHAKAEFAWSKEPTVIVHWEENNIDYKGGTWIYSLNWFKQYRNYLSTKGRTHFIFKFVVLRNFKKRHVLKGFKYFFKYCKPWHLSLKNYYFMMSTILFGKVIVP
ncbi:glycosyltransferase family 2 protein [uncultured Winogradskyella sp.]|uniref:glycosyltransferase family 2 protein n=1 Tax=uncultured Winogradskyella sp. TaxID=395353 RepID=UPI0026357A4F|nr:glycosyltransferase family 2 protein [uncultured Winogradskyella sp.]